MVEEHEEKLETWYFHKQTTFPSLENWLCYDVLKGLNFEIFHYLPNLTLILVCCPKNTWGKKCEPCPGDSETPCYGRGKCDVIPILWFILIVICALTFFTFFRVPVPEKELENVNATLVIKEIYVENVPLIIIQVFKTIPTLRANVILFVLYISLRITE